MVLLRFAAPLDQETFWGEEATVNPRIASECSFVGGINTGFGRAIALQLSAEEYDRVAEEALADLRSADITADIPKSVGKCGATFNGITTGPILTPAIEIYLQVRAKRMKWEGDIPELERRYL